MTDIAIGANAPGDLFATTSKTSSGFAWSSRAKPLTARLLKGCLYLFILAQTLSILVLAVMLWAFQVEGELDMSLFANPARLAPQDAEAFGRGLATLLIEAARGSVKLTEIEAMTGLGPVVRGPHWLVSDGCWVDLDEVDDLLATVLAGLPLSEPYAVKTVAEPDERLGHRLVCTLTKPDGGEPLGQADLERIHAACVAALPRRPAAMAPHLYRVSTGAAGTGRPSR